MSIKQITFYAILAYVMIMAVLYLLFSFCYLTINPAIWTEGGRFLYSTLAFTFGSISVFGLVIALMSHDDDQKSSKQ